MERGWPCAAEPCGDAPRWRGHVSDDGKAIAVRLSRAG
jgi:hypothetical protein